MNRNLLFAVSLLFSVSGFGQPAFSGELDNEATVINEQARRDLPQTVIVRVDEKTGAAAVVELKEALAADVSALAQLPATEFKAIAPTTGELDRTSSSSSWYVWYNYGYYYAPTYYYWGYNYSYSNYYYCNWAGYNYYWYGYRW